MILDRFEHPYFIIFNTLNFFLFAIISIIFEISFNLESKILQQILFFFLILTEFVDITSFIFLMLTDFDFIQKM